MTRRNTVPKKEILSVLKASDSALSHEMIQAEFKSMNRATIYRVLNRFCEDGIVHRIVGDDGKQYFALCLDCQEKGHRHKHFHFRCVECGKVECIKGEFEVTLPEGYISERFNGVISGWCRECPPKSE